MKNISLVSFLLRIGLAGVFLFAAIDSFLNPTSWIGYLPFFLRNSGFSQTILFAFSVYEVLLGAWLLCNKYIFYAASLAALTLFAILVVNIGQLELLFRDVAIMFMAAALAVLENPKYQTSSTKQESKF